MSVSEMIVKIEHQIKTFLKKLLRIVNKKPINVQLTPEQQKVLPWIRDNGDKTHRLHYDLSKQSVVMDLGGYEGQWSSDIFSMYCCQIHIFEPVPDFSENIKRRFARNPNIRVHQFGLACNDVTTSISLTGDSSSRYKNSEKMVNIQLITASKFFEEFNISSVSLMKLYLEVLYSFNQLS